MVTKLLKLVALALSFCVPCNAHLPIGSSFGVPGANASFDYVIVGGGTAGLTIATRLAQDGRYSVAVVEAGGFYEFENGNHSVVPGYVYDGWAVASPLVDWGFTTTPQTGAANRSLLYVRGKTLGGSSARNGMVYQRPTVGSMAKWAKEVGDKSWAWPNVLKYFERSATLTLPPQAYRPANATPGYDLSVFAGGPLQVSYPRYAAALASWIFKATSQLGLPVEKQGFEGGTLLGHAYVSCTVDPGSQERSTSQTTYMPLGIATGRLIVYTHTMAKRVIFNGTTAVGVSVEANGAPFSLSANKEVVVSAGAFQSPQLLMVSGIGPAATLKQNGVAVIVDRPGVGQNMWDNPLFAVSYAVNVETSSTYLNNPQRLAEAVADYNGNRTGYLTSSGADVISFEKLSNLTSLNISKSAQRDLAQFPPDWPEVEFWSVNLWWGPFQGAPPPDTVHNYGSIAPGLIAPLSRGYVTINSSDMSDPPVINPNWLTHPTDQELAIAAIRRAREYFATPALKSISVGAEAFPGVNVTTDAEILSALQKQVGTFYHASATCKMGVENDTMAVVDSKARVFGAENLRVVDISAFPFLPPGQPQATVYMLAEKIAEDILGNGGGGNRTARRSLPEYEIEASVRVYENLAERYSSIGDG